MNHGKVLALILSVAMVFGSFNMTFAAEPEVTSTNAAQFKDVAKHWGASAINKWSGYGIISGYNGLFRPNDSITRGEIAVILDNMMDYQDVAKSTFTDLKSGKFYTDAVLKANAADIIKGDGNKVRPTDKITREEAAVILARAFAVDASTSGTASFSDSASIASWAQGYVRAMEAKGYVKGSNSNFLPKTNITRAEIVTMIDNIVKAYYTKAGTYTENVNGTAVIKVSDVTLKGVSISENLIVAEGVGQGDATLDSVTVKGNTVVRGGGENSVHIVGTSNITSVRIEKTDGKIRVVISDGNTVKEVEVAEGEEIIVAGTVGTLDVAASNAKIYATAAEITKANITGENSTVIVDTKSKISSVAVSDTGKNASIQTQEGAQIGTITAEAGVKVSGKGKVTNVDLKDGADGSSITTPNTKTTVDKGVTGVTGGGGKAISEGSTETNNAAGNNLIGSSGGSSGNGGPTLFTDVTSPGYATASTNNTVTVTLTGGTFKSGAIASSDFTFAGTNAAALAAGTFTRTSDTVVTISNLTLAAGADNTVLVKGAIQATQAASVAGAASTVLTTVISPGYSTVSTNNTVTVTLTGGTFKAGAIAASDFTFAGTNAAAMAAGTFTRTSATVVTISNLTLEAGADNTVLVKSATQATQATSVAATASTNYFTFNTATQTITGYTTAGGLDVVIPSTIAGVTVTTIGYGAFQNKSLNSVTIPDSVTTIGNSAFYSNNLTSATIGNGVITIGDSAFENNALTGIIIPNNVTSIGDDAFSNNQLTSATIGNGVITIGDSAFYNNDLTGIIIPNNVTSIGDYAFKKNMLTSVTIGTSVITIGGEAFLGDGTAGSNRITSLNIPSSVTTIGDYSFQNNALTSLTIPDSVTIIGDRAFSLNALTSVTIGDNVSTIEECAFAGNSPLTAAYFEGDVPATLGSDIFLGSNGSFKLYYHAVYTDFVGVLNAYAKDTY